MAKLPTSLVFFVLAIMMLIFQESFGKSQLRIWILSVRSKYSISVKETGGVTASPTKPTLYSLIRIRMDEEEGNDFNSKFTLEGVAAGHRICMNKKGIMTTEDMKLKRKKKKVNPRQENEMTKMSRGIDHILPPSDDCWFQSFSFNSSMIYKFGTSIYSVSQSNATVGRFIAFNAKGLARSYKRPFANVTNHSVVIQFIEPKNMNEYIDATTFNRCDGKPGGRVFNTLIKQCIKKRKRATSLSHIRHSNILFRVIKKCQRQACKFRKSSVMRQDSLQRKVPKDAPTP